MFVSLETRELVKRIAEILEASGTTLAVSEGACGGLISSSIVSVPGASKYFLGGTTTYALRSRLALSGWAPDKADEYTGPSEEVAKRLARNLRMELGATWVLAETGWAGPGENAGKLYLSVAGPSVTIATTKETSEANDRVANMEEFGHIALRYLLETLTTYT